MLANVVIGVLAALFTQMALIAFAVAAWVLLASSRQCHPGESFFCIDTSSAIVYSIPIFAIGIVLSGIATLSWLVLFGRIQGPRRH